MQKLSQCILCTPIATPFLDGLRPRASFKAIQYPPSDVFPSFHVILDWTGRDWQCHASLFQAPKWPWWLCCLLLVSWCSVTAITPLALANGASTWVCMQVECICHHGSCVWGWTAMIGGHFCCWWRLIAMVEWLAGFPFSRGLVSTQNVQNELYMYIGISTMIYLRLQYLHNMCKKTLPGKNLVHFLVAYPVCQTKQWNMKYYCLTN